MTKKRRFTDEEYVEMAANDEAHPPATDENLSVEINPAVLREEGSRNGGGPSGAERPDTDDCVECGCPVNEHDSAGRCHALDLPQLGHVNDCTCPGLVAP